MSKLFSPIRIGAIDAMTSAWGRDRVGARIGPSNKFGAMGDSTPDVTFPYVARALTHFGAAYLHVIEPRVVANMSVGDNWRSVFLVNIPIGIASLAVAPFVLEKTNRIAQQRLDLPGVALSTIGLSLLMVPLIEGPDR
jgi:2,4-dienoyl-CoA reductase-like NADH-dependent reductase (Old Yellow Enzyme family)